MDIGTHDYGKASEGGAVVARKLVDLADNGNEIENPADVAQAGASIVWLTGQYQQAIKAQPGA